MEFEGVTFSTTKLERLKAFYTKTLELPLTHETAEDFSVLVGHTLLTFEAYEGEGDPFYHFAMNIPSNKVNEAKTWLEQRVTLKEYKNNPIVSFKSWNAHALYFEDPAGNIVELIARHNLNQRIDVPFDSQALQCISEVGIVTCDLDAQTKQFERMGVPVWDQGSEHFRALGNENGLFIAVSDNRLWFMSERKSELYPLTIQTRTNGKLVFM
ncbi:VOC family protein [Halalkalibacterium ligniniphilum]|uniref:VOC family protein n=1 Tax=Halalkalibacterium ligniniphilum TaxID=1134413 RepID=UPI0003476EAD|nr:hypothetical protein [Halalkalibacterium ligniniphilum]